MNKNREYVFTDLACEAFDGDKSSFSGAFYTEYELNGMEITELKITEKSAEKALGRARGTYITVQTGKLWEMGEEAHKNAVMTLSENLNDLMHSAKKKIESILVCGLGNRMVTPDAIGPIVIDNVAVTRHLREEMPCRAGYSPYDICAVAPGVVGQTGMETAELVRGVVDTVCPDLIIAVDALAARGLERLATTIQLTDTGIRPGSGIGQKRRELSHQTLGVPVIAVGVPTVISGATLAYDMLCENNIPLDGSAKKAIEGSAPFFLSLNESDLVIGTMARVVAEAINMTLLS